jgi:hypothetical protein
MMKKRSQVEIDLLMSTIKINVGEAYEVKHWAKQFKVTDSNYALPLQKWDRW